MTLTHGLSHKHPLYERWEGMRARCNNPGHKAYERYGGRGIRVCRCWDEFPNFLEDMEATWPGPGYELHRLDDDGDYTPENCVWLAVTDHRSLPKSAEHRAKIGAAHKGRKKSPEHVAKQAQAQRAPLDPEWLRDVYERRGLTIYDIAAEAGCGKSSVHRALRRHGIQRKNPAAAEGISP